MLLCSIVRIFEAEARMFVNFIYNNTYTQKMPWQTPNFTIMSYGEPSVKYHIANANLMDVVIDPLWQKRRTGTGIFGSSHYYWMKPFMDPFESFIQYSVCLLEIFWTQTWKMSLSECHLGMSVLLPLVDSCCLWHHERDALGNTRCIFDICNIAYFNNPANILYPNGPINLLQTSFMVMDVWMFVGLMWADEVDSLGNFDSW